MSIRYDARITALLIDTAIWPLSRNFGTALETKRGDLPAKGFSAMAYLVTGYPGDAGYEIYDIKLVYNQNMKKTQHK